MFWRDAHLSPSSPLKVNLLQFLSSDVTWSRWRSCQEYFGGRQVRNLCPSPTLGTKLRLRVLILTLQPQPRALTRAWLLLLYPRQSELCLPVKFAHCDFYAQWRGRTRLKISCLAALEKKYIHVKNSQVNSTSLLSA